MLLLQLPRLHWYPRAMPLFPATVLFLVLDLNATLLVYVLMPGFSCFPLGACRHCSALSLLDLVHRLVAHYGCEGAERAASYFVGVSYAAVEVEWWCMVECDRS